MTFPNRTFRNHTKPEKLAFARKLRKNPTPAERVLWSFLRKDQLGLRFRRQAIILGWIVDFYCAKCSLVIEVDGPVHRATKSKDQIRERVMARKGFRTIRFTNDQVLDDPQKVVNLIRAAIDERSESTRTISAKVSKG